MLFGVLSMFLTGRMLSVRVTVDADVVWVEGVATGFMIPREATMRVVADRRVFGWEGLAIVTADGQRRKLPLTLTTADHAETARLRAGLEAAFETK